MRPLSPDSGDEDEPVAKKPKDAMPGMPGAQVQAGPTALMGMPQMAPGMQAGQPMLMHPMMGASPFMMNHMGSLMGQNNHQMQQGQPPNKPLFPAVAVRIFVFLPLFPTLKINFSSQVSSTSLASTLVGADFKPITTSAGAILQKPAFPAYGYVQINSIKVFLIA